MEAMLEDIRHCPELGRALSGKSLRGGAGAAPAAADERQFDGVVLGGVTGAGDGAARAAPANAVPEVLRNSRRVVRLGSVRLVEFIVRKVIEFAKCERFIAVGPIIPLRPALGKAVSDVFLACN